MAKKLIWIDNTRPPTNYIWVRTDPNNNLAGIYQYDGYSWVKLPIEGDGGACVTEGDGTIKGTTITGETVQIGYSISPMPNNIPVRTGNGTLLSITPDGDNPREVVTVEMISWEED